jgi:uncharacterized protein (TIGR00106 family)
MNVASDSRNSGSRLGAARESEKATGNERWYRKPSLRTFGNASQIFFENQLMGGSFMLADFAVVPMGVTGGVKNLVAEALEIVDESGLSYKLGAMHTTIEGDSDRVMEVILRCHRRMLELAPRVLTSITIDDRTGATGRLEGKVRDVEQVLGKPLSRV